VVFSVAIHPVIFKLIDAARRKDAHEGVRSMNNVIAFAITTAVGLAFALPMDGALAQEKQRVSFKVPAANTKYTQQHVIDVGDAPGHQIRIFELHRTYTGNQPVINGLKLVENWSRAFSDYTDGNGLNPGYSEYLFENGDKFFTRFTCVAASPGEGKIDTTCTALITGGTGKFSNIRGVIRSSNKADPKAGFNENQAEIEYYMAK
jgi:hypothetical protein